MSSQHHDSAYDSTDPDGDGEAGDSTSSTHEGCGSFPSLSPSLTSSWPSGTISISKPVYSRRCSEPIILHSADIESLCSHSRSHDDCLVAKRDFKDQPLKKQISDDSFLLRRRDGSKIETLIYNANQIKDCSCSSLESSASNQSEGSVFTSSPTGSPPNSRRTNATNQNTVGAKAQQDLPMPNSDEKKRSHSMRVSNKILLRTRSLGGFSRGSLKKDSQKDNSFPCETLQEDSQSEADPPAEHKPRPLSAIEVFKQADSRLPCRPPTYEQAVHHFCRPPQYGSMTVHDAVELERRSRPSSVNYDFPSTCSVNQYNDCFTQVTLDKANVVDRRMPFRKRATSESVSKGHHEVVSRRCSQPVFEEFSYAKESYIWLALKSFHILDFALVR